MRWQVGHHQYIRKIIFFLFQWENGNRSFFFYSGVYSLALAHINCERWSSMYAVPTQMPYKNVDIVDIPFRRGWVRVRTQRTSSQRLLLNISCGTVWDVNLLSHVNKYKCLKSQLIIIDATRNRTRKYFLPLKIANDAHFNVHSTVYTRICLYTSTVLFQVPASCRIQNNCIEFSLLVMLKSKPKPISTVIFQFVDVAGAILFRYCTSSRLEPKP